MNIGELNKRAVIQEKVETPDGAGGFTSTWEDLDTVWCKLKPSNAREQLIAMQQTHTVMNRVIIRYYKTISTAMRLKIEDKYYNIRGFTNPDEKKRFHDVIVEEGVAT